MAESIAERLDGIFDDMDPELVEKFQRVTHLCRTLTSMYSTNSIDFDTVVGDVFLYYNGTVPKELIVDVVSTYLPIILADRSLTLSDGQLTEDAIEIAQTHLEIFADPSQSTHH